MGSCVGNDDCTESTHEDLFNFVITVLLAEDAMMTTRQITLRPRGRSGRGFENHDDVIVKVDRLSGVCKDTGLPGWHNDVRAH